MTSKVMTTMGRWIGFVAGVLWTWPARRCGWALRSLFRGQPQGAVRPSSRTEPDWVMVAVDAHRIGEQASATTQRDTVVIERIVYVERASLIGAVKRGLRVALKSREFEMIAIVTCVMVAAFAVFAVR